MFCDARLCVRDKCELTIFLYNQLARVSFVCVCVFARVCVCVCECWMSCFNLQIAKNNAFNKKENKTKQIMITKSNNKKE